MLGKLMTYELRALWKPAAIMLAIMVVAGIAGTACLGATRAISEVSWGTYGSLAAPTAGNATVVLFMGALFCAFLVWAAVVAFYVFSSMRFYRTLFTDEGYLALTLPVPTGTLVMAKFWVSYLALAAFALMALLAYTLMALAVSGGDIDAVTGVASMMGGWFAFAADGDGASALLGCGNMLVTCAYALSLAYGSLTLGAWWARRHKVAAAVGVYLGVGSGHVRRYDLLGLRPGGGGGGANAHEPRRRRRVSGPVDPPHPHQGRPELGALPILAASATFGIPSAQP